MGRKATLSRKNLEAIIREAKSLNEDVLKFSGETLVLPRTHIHKCRGGGVLYHPKIFSLGDISENDLCQFEDFSISLNLLNKKLGKKHSLIFPNLGNFVNASTEFQFWRLYDALLDGINDLITKSKDLKLPATFQPLSEEEKEDLLKGLKKIYLKGEPIDLQDYDRDLHLIVALLMQDFKRELQKRRSGPELRGILGLEKSIMDIGKKGGKPSPLFGNDSVIRFQARAKKLGHLYWLNPAVERA